MVYHICNFYDVHNDRLTQSALDMELLRHIAEMTCCGQRAKKFWQNVPFDHNVEKSVGVMGYKSKRRDGSCQDRTLEGTSGPAHPSQPRHWEHDNQPVTLHPPTRWKAVYCCCLLRTHWWLGKWTGTHRHSTLEDRHPYCSLFYTIHLRRARHSTRL